MPLQKSLVLLPIATLMLAAVAHAQTGQCTLIAHVDGFRNDKGDAGATLFRTADGWPENNDKAVQHGPFPIAGQKSTVAFTNLAPGKYAFAVIHDENGNHKLDRNFLGIPKEGFGFANNPHVALTTPSFDTAAVNVACPSTTIQVHIQYK